MFITRWPCRGARSCAAWARRWRCRCWTRWCRRCRRMAQTAANPVRRLGFVYIPMGMNAAAWTPAARRPDHRAVAVAARRSRRSSISSRWSRNLELRNAYTTGNHASSNCAFLSCSRAKRTEGSDYELGTTVDQIAAQQHRQRHADPVARARHRSDRAGRQLRQRLRLRLSEQPVVVVADDAAADRSRPARGLRAAVRRRRQPASGGAPSCGRTAASSTG